MCIWLMQIEFCADGICKLNRQMKRQRKDTQTTTTKKINTAAAAAYKKKVHKQKAAVNSKVSIEMPVQKHVVRSYTAEEKKNIVK